MEILEELDFISDKWMFLFPLILMILDVVTGYYNAWKKKQVKSKKMRDGIGKKLAEIIYILLGFGFSYVFNVDSIRYFVSIYIIYMEFISIIENCKKLGVPIPDKIFKLEDEIDDKRNWYKRMAKINKFINT